MENYAVVPIYSKKLALLLRQKGFTILYTEPNRRWPQYDIYFFRDDTALQSELTKYIAQRQEEKQDGIDLEHR